MIKHCPIGGVYFGVFGSVRSVLRLYVAIQATTTPSPKLACESLVEFASLQFWAPRD